MSPCWASRQMKSYPSVASRSVAGGASSITQYPTSGSLARTRCAKLGCCTHVGLQTLVVTARTKSSDLSAAP